MCHNNFELQGSSSNSTACTHRTHRDRSNALLDSTPKSIVDSNCKQRDVVPLDSTLKDVALDSTSRDVVPLDSISRDIAPLDSNPRDIVPLDSTPRDNLDSTPRQSALPCNTPKEALQAVLQMSISVQNRLKKAREKVSTETAPEISAAVRWLSKQARDDSEASG